MKAELNCAWVVYGVQFVTTFGMMLMLQWCAGNLGSPGSVSAVINCKV